MAPRSGGWAAGKRSTSYWLDDGETHFSFSDNLLVLDPPLGNRRNLRNNMASWFWLFQGPTWDGNNLTVSEYCEVVLGLIEEKRLFVGDNPRAALQIKESPEVVKIEMVGFEQSDGQSRTVGGRTVVVLDPARNYVMTGYEEWNPASTGPDANVFEKDIVSEYREITPGIFFLSQGRWWQKFSGTELEEAGYAREAEVSVAVEAVEFGDLAVEDAYFDVHHWPPIEKGIKVYDNRVLPPADFVYADGPFDKQVLERALRDVHFSNGGQNSTRFWFLVGANVVILIGLCLWFVLRKIM